MLITGRSSWYSVGISFSYLQSANASTKFKCSPCSHSKPNLGHLALGNPSNWRMSSVRRTKVCYVFAQMVRDHWRSPFRILEFVDILNSIRFGRLSREAVFQIRALSREVVYGDGIEPTDLCVFALRVQFILMFWACSSRAHREQIPSPGTSRYCQSWQAQCVAGLGNPVSIRRSCWPWWIWSFTLAHYGIDGENLK